MDRPDTAFDLRRWLTPAAISLVAWLVIELLLVGQVMHLDSFDLGEAIKITLPRSSMWLIFAPLAVCLAFLFPMERGRLTRSVVAHLVACALLLASIHQAVQNFAGGPNPIHGPSSSVAQPLQQNRDTPSSRGGPMAHLVLAHLALNLLFFFFF